MAKDTPLYNEHNVLQLVAQGDPAAFRVLFDEYKHKVYSYAMHYTHQEDLAEELVQETFMKVWLHREELPQIERFEAWLFTICRNLSFNHLRKIARRQALHTDLPGQTELATGTADEPLLTKEYDALLKTAVDRLPPQQKLIYILHREQHLTLDEIAGKLGLARTTVKSHLAVAMRSIRRYITTYREMAPLLVLWWINR